LFTTKLQPNHFPLPGLGTTQADAAKQAEGDLIDAMEPEEYVVEVEAGGGAWSHGWGGWMVGSFLPEEVPKTRGVEGE